MDNYPNPTTGEFVIYFSGNETSILIYIQNCQGRPMQEVEFHEDKKVKIDISNLQSGICIILIKTQTEYIAKKIIKSY